MINIIIGVGTVLWMILLHYIGFFDLGVVVYGLWGSLVCIPAYFVLRVPFLFCVGFAEGIGMAWEETRGSVIQEEVNG